MYNFKNKSWPIQPHKILHVMKWIKAQTFFTLFKVLYAREEFGNGVFIVSPARFSGR